MAAEFHSNLTAGVLLATPIDNKPEMLSIGFRFSGKEKHCMPEQNTDQVRPAETPFITASEAIAKLEELIALAPTGGTRFGITTSYASRQVRSHDFGNQE